MKDWGMRAIRTFFQAFAGVMLTQMATGDYNLQEWKTWILPLLSSAIAAGCSALLNYVPKNAESNYLVDQEKEGQG